MAAPNLANLNSIIGKTSVQAVTTNPTAIVENASNSGKVLKINVLYISNVDNTSDGQITIDLFRSSTSYRLGNNIIIPTNSTLDVISKSLYLEEGDSLRISSDVNSILEGVCSYEEIG